MKYKFDKCCYLALGINKEVMKKYMMKITDTLKTLREMIRPRYIKSIIVVIIILIVFTYWLCPSHLFYLIWGFIALAFGPILNEWSKKWYIGKQFLGVIFISIMVALGGLLSTLGWNEWTNFKEDQVMLISVATEVKIMETCIDTTRKVMQYNVSSESGNTLPYIIIPTLKESNYALTHSNTVRCDPELKHAITVYIMGALKFDQAYHHLMQASYVKVMDKATRRKILESFIKEEGPLDYLSHCNKFLGDYMERDYPKVMNLAEQQVDTEYLDAIKSMEFVYAEEDNNSVLN